MYVRTHVRRYIHVYTYTHLISNENVFAIHFSTAGLPRELFRGFVVHLASRTKRILHSVYRKVNPVILSQIAGKGGKEDRDLRKAGLIMYIVCLSYDNLTLSC